MWGGFGENRLQYRIGLVWNGSTFDERGHGEVWGVQDGVDGHKISFSMGAWFSCDEQKDGQEGLL